jgi:superfamily II DNA/RNA helicase
MTIDERSKIFFEYSYKKLLEFKELEKNEKREGFRMLFLASQREVMYRYYNEMKKYNISSYFISGDKAITKEADYIDLNEPEVIFATPGRLLDVLKVKLKILII